MLSCPFLKKLSPNVIQRDAQQLWAYAAQCPFARRIFEKAQMSSLSSVLPEREANAPNEYSDHDVCKDVNECRLTQCPYVASKSFTATNECGTAETDLDRRSCVGVADSNCFQIPVKSVDGSAIPRSCALFAGWTATRKKFGLKDSKVTDKTPNQSPAEGFDYSSLFQNEIERKKKDSTYRIFRRVLRDAKDFPFADDFSTGTRRRVAVWCSNDYLGMSWHPKVQEAAINAIKLHGVGSGGTRNISGNSVLHEALEADLADLHGKPSALVFTSCYVANEASLHTLGTRIPGVTILSDAGNHASMIHGIRTSRAPKLIYRHNDVRHLSSLLSTLPLNSPKVVAFETVHSMTGDVCPLNELLTLSEANNALSFVDEVHAVGLYGAHGAGVAERDGLMHRIDAISGTLGKAFASVGGYLAGSRDLIDMIRSYAAGFIFTTSLPPPILAAARASIEVLRSADGRRLRAEHQRRVQVVRKRLEDEGLPVLPAPSHILPLHVGEADLCTRISQELLAEHNIYVQSINYPTVDKGDERLRIAPTPHHTDQMTEQLVDALCTIWQRYDLPLVSKSAEFENQLQTPVGA